MKKCILSCWRTVDNDSADISHPAGHSRSVGRQTGKPSWLQLSNWLEALPDQMVSGNRMERLASRQVSDVVQWAEVLWYCGTSVTSPCNTFIHLDGNLVPNSLPRAQPGET